MTTENTQTVVEATPAPAEPGATETNARTSDDLETLLAQYQDATSQPPPTPEPTPPEPISAERVRRLEQKLFEDEVNQTVNNIVGELKVPRRFAIGWLDQMARENPKLQQAFLNKNQDPKTWKRFEKSLSEELRKEFASFQVDPDATADREAVAAAVRGASTKAPTEPPPKFGNMSNAEYRKKIADEYGFDPGV